MTINGSNKNKKKNKKRKRPEPVVENKKREGEPKKRVKFDLAKSKTRGKIGFFNF